MIYPDVARNAPAGDCVHRRAVPVYPALRESGRNVCMSAATELQSMLDRVPAFRSLSPEQRDDLRSEERRVGKECVSTCRCLLSRDLKKTKQREQRTHNTETKK